MSYKYAVSNDRPVNYFLLEETSGTALIDYLTGVTGGTYSALPTSYHPIVSNALNSKNFTTQVATMSSPLSKLWNAGYTTKPFSIEFGFSVLNNNTSSAIFSSDTNNGVFVIPEGIKFVVAGVKNVHSLVAPLPDRGQINYHVVCIYDVDNLQIYINGKLVNSEPFNDQISQSAATFKINSNATGPYLLSNLAIYRKALTMRTIGQHYSQMITNTFFSNFVKDVGTYFTLDDDSTDMYVDNSISGLNLLDGYSINNIEYVGNGVQVLPNNLPGSRVDFYPLSAYTTIGGSRIDWDSSSSYFTVDVSLDFGATWVTNISNHTEIPGLTRGTNTTAVGLMVRQNFSSVAPSGDSVYGNGIYSDGIYGGSGASVYGDGTYGSSIYGGNPGIGSNDTYSDGIYGQELYGGGYASLPPYLNRIHVVIYSNKNPKCTDTSMRSTGTEPYNVSEDILVPIKNNKNALVMKSGSKLVIPPAAGNSIYAIEFLLKVDSRPTTGNLHGIVIDADNSKGFFIAAEGVAPTVTGYNMYINGVLKTPTNSDFPVGKWVHVGIVPTSANTTGFIINTGSTSSFNGDASYQWLGLYYAAPNTGIFLKHYKSAFGTLVNSVTEPNTFGVTETNYVPYSNKWGVSVG